MDDAVFFDQAFLIGNKLDVVLLDSGHFMEKDWFVVALAYGDDDIHNLLGYTAHKRFRDPKVSLLSTANSVDVDGGETLLELAKADHGGPCMRHITVYGLALAMLKKAPHTISVTIKKYNIQNFKLMDERCP